MHRAQLDHLDEHRNGSSGHTPPTPGRRHAVALRRTLRLAGRPVDGVMQAARRTRARSRRGRGRRRPSRSRRP
jgi:hypothetical protein